MTKKTLAAPLSVWRPINIDTFLLGAPHYPEHVDESYWERDAERMAAAGFNSVRLGEFAWHIFEPRENSFDFDLFDRAITVLAKHGIKTIMCTPTATPPCWLTYHPEDDLSRLKVLHVPHWLIWKHDWTDRIRAFAEGGCTVILTARTGTRDENNHIIRDAAPGRSLATLAGVTVEEFGRLAPPDGDGLFELGGRYGANAVRQRFSAESAQRTYALKVGNQDVAAAHMYELLNVNDGTEVIGSWSNRFLEGQAAITCRTVGKGRIVYAGTYLTPALIDTLIAGEFERAGVTPLLADKPADIEVTLREADGRQLLFVLNLSHEARSVANLPAGEALVGAAFRTDEVATPPGHECLILALA